MENSNYLEIVTALRKQIWQAQDHLHKCSTSLIMCCSQQRCEPCHTRHMIACHGKPLTMKWWQFHQAPSLILDEPRSARLVQEHKEKEQKVAKQQKMTKAMRDVERVLRTFSPEELQQLIDGIKEDLEK